MLWLIGIIGLTYVEFSIREPEPTLYAIMFASVLVINVAFAIDAYRELKTADATKAPADQGTLGDTAQASQSRDDPGDPGQERSDPAEKEP